MTGRARILRAEAAARGAPLFASVVSARQGRRMAREELEGRQTAERIVQRARAEAQALVDRVSAETSEAASEAVRRAEADACARETARWLLARKRDDDRLESQRDRLIAVAVALAERLLGASLELDPERIASLAGAVLAEARGARRVVIEAHPLDARALRGHLEAAGLDLQSFEVREASGLARGDLLLHTDLGTIDARIALRFDRLAAALRDALD